MRIDCFFTDSVSSWVERVNRWGLFLVNNNFYTFILIIEFDVRKILNVSFLISYSRENMRGIIVEKLRDNDALKSNWDFIAKYL